MMDPPHSLLALRLLYPPTPPISSHSTLLITYTDGHLHLSELPKDTLQPSASKLIPLDYPPTTR
jgi:hypothetical protein